MTKQRKDGEVIAAVRAALSAYSQDRPVTAKTIHERVYNQIGGIDPNHVYKTLRKFVDQGEAAAFAPNGPGDVKRYYPIRKAAHIVPTKPKTNGVGALAPAAAAAMNGTHSPARESSAPRAQVAGGASAPALPFVPDADAPNPFAADHARELGELDAAAVRQDRLDEIASRGTAPDAAALADMERTIREMLPPAVPAPAQPNEERQPVNVPRRIVLSCGGFAADRYVADFQAADGSIELWIDALERAQTNGTPAQPSTKRLRIVEADDLRIVRRFLSTLSGELPADLSDELAEWQGKLATAISLLAEHLPSATKPDGSNFVWACEKLADELGVMKSDLAAAQQLAEEAEQRASKAEHELAALRAWRTKLESIGMKFEG